jgi:hypothetical protein
MNQNSEDFRYVVAQIPDGARVVRVRAVRETERATDVFVSSIPGVGVWCRNGCSACGVEPRALTGRAVTASFEVSRIATYRSAAGATSTGTGSAEYSPANTLHQKRRRFRIPVAARALWDIFGKQLQPRSTATHARTQTSVVLPPHKSKEQREPAVRAL